MALESAIPWVEGKEALSMSLSLVLESFLMEVIPISITPSTEMTLNSMILNAWIRNFPPSVSSRTETSGRASKLLCAECTEA